MRRIIIALPALALLTGSTLTYAEDMTPSKNSTTEGRAAKEYRTAPSSSDKANDSGGTIPDGPNASGISPNSDNKGQGG